MESPPAGIPFPEDSQALGKLSVNQDLQKLCHVWTGLVRPWKEGVQFRWKVLDPLPRDSHSGNNSGLSSAPKQEAPCGGLIAKVATFPHPSLPAGPLSRDPPSGEVS